VKTDDFEVIVADNSDDPGAAWPSIWASSFQDDRFRLIPPAPSVLSMVDNWERAVGREPKGRWISVIGDDDYVDPRLAEHDPALRGLYRDVDAISWERMTFQWPDNRPVPTLATHSAGKRGEHPAFKTGAERSAVPLERTQATPQVSASASITERSSAR
jgi:hypothetical protein